MSLPAITNLTYKYWLYKNNRKDSFDAFTEYYIWSVHEVEGSLNSFDKAPKWLQEATIKEAYKHRFINHIF